MGFRGALLPQAAVAATVALASCNLAIGLHKGTLEPGAGGAATSATTTTTASGSTTATATATATATSTATASSGGSGGMGGGTPCMHYVFVTSTPYGGNLGGIMVADQHCSDLAPKMPPPNVYKWLAILSTGTQSAKDAIVQKGPVCLLNGGTGDHPVVADSGNLWSGSLNIPIDHDECGNSVGNVDVWTGTHCSGGDPSCGATANGFTCDAKGDWMSSMGPGVVGHTGETGSGWLEAFQADDCSSMNLLYCISMPL